MKGSYRVENERVVKESEIIEIGTHCYYIGYMIYSKCSIIFLKDFIYLFLDRGEGREKERKRRNMNVWLPLVYPLLETWPANPACALTGNRTRDPLVCRLALYPLSHTSQG